MVFVFDLDDTLYEEKMFVLSGFKIVSEFLSSTFRSQSSDIYQALINEFEIKREHVFDRLLQKFGLYSKSLVRKCVAIYRAHSPQIQLFPEALDCLQRLSSYPIYVVTDGNKLVQKRKFLALHLEHYVKKCLCTYTYGLKYSKPSPYCFEKICEWEKVSPKKVVYVADNPNKDFVGIKPFGFQTIRMLTGPYKDIVVDEKYDASITLHHLAELNDALLKKIEENAY